MTDNFLPFYDVIIIGSGSGGTAIVNKICNHFKNLKVAILDSSEVVYNHLS